MSTENTNTIFDRILSGETVSFKDPEYYKLPEQSERAIAILADLNASKTINDIRQHLGKLIQSEIDSTTTIYTPFSVNYGKNLKLGKNIFINQNCQILDLGGVTIDDDVMIGPRVNLLSETHPLDPESREALIGKPIHIKKGAWIGAASTILPGVTVGEHAIVAAGAVVSKDVPDRTVVAGIPAKIIKNI
ncbi:sugar O-acetyltransferase [Mangrovimonas spongiae]|uniref:Sugar O-acetyltransferase n=1 Tax=Mangrovimonas spongiae TaxID=2494697 RepID=A0A428JY42_9FLAO|nr:sugar O-acetyltransferase [Mangrovimonas spongiae]RSK39052.1 sugar O-acetyltransferase [Mangrovimonas spongiae]